MKRDQELAVIEHAMRSRGYRWTSQRRLVTRAALGTHEHFQAEELLALCRRQDKTVSRATIYRTLMMLEDAGFVSGLDTGDGGRRFEHTLGHEHHDHMVCMACGKILEFRDDELERLQERAAHKRGFQVLRHTLKLFGLCAECRSKGVPAPKERQRVS
jgi:Fur family ferric uptake transcriptional regulator